MQQRDKTYLNQPSFRNSFDSEKQKNVGRIVIIYIIIIKGRESLCLHAKEKKTLANKAELSHKWVTDKLKLLKYTCWKTGKGGLKNKLLWKICYLIPEKQNEF